MFCNRLNEKSQFSCSHNIVAMFEYANMEIDRTRWRGPIISCVRQTG